MSRESLRLEICSRVKQTETTAFALVLALCFAIGIFPKGGDEVLEMVHRQRRAFAKAGHVGAHVIDPDVFGVILVSFAPGKKKHIGFHALGIENSGGQAQDGVQIAFIHQVGTDLLAVPVGKQHIVRQDHGRPGFAIRFQAAVNHLQKIELFIGCGKKSGHPGWAVHRPRLVPKGGLVRIRS